MNWVRGVLTDTDDDGRFRSGLGAILGACLATLPLLFGMVDAQTALIATLIGSVVASWPYRFGDRSGEPWMGH